ncbi:MAG: hypothetical protein AAB577_00415 [Patescibacteria group bacterium]
MPQKPSSEENFKILEKLPEELKEVLFSLDTADNIADICEKFKVPAGKISLVAGTTGKVLSKTLPLGDFQKTLKEEVGLEGSVAKNVSDEINFRIFSKVKESLAPTPIKNVPGGIISLPSAEETPKRPPSKDSYREKIE